MQQKILLSPYLSHPLPKVTHNWSFMHGQHPPKGAIVLTHGYVERIPRYSLRSAVRDNIVFYPIPKFGIIAGPLLEGEPILGDFMEDMQELLLTQGFLENYYRRAK